MADLTFAQLTSSLEVELEYVRFHGGFLKSALMAHTKMVYLHLAEQMKIDDAINHDHTIMVKDFRKFMDIIDNG